MVENGGPPLSSQQQALVDMWEEHMRHEFATQDVDETMRTMVAEPWVNHVPVLTGGFGREQVRDFYGRHFIPRMPPDMTITPVARTVGATRIVDEMVISFTHSVHMDWMLPGLQPTGRRVEVPFVAVVEFEGTQVAAERIYWDQATVLAQLGLLDAATLPAAGPESARKVLDPSLPSNQLIERAGL